jgi:hypothetical protein
MKKKLLGICWIIALSAPIIIFLFKFVIQSHGNLAGDWDYFAQLYEAARNSILNFNQFPWWNPWVAGGVPLYGNPQFGLISLQMPLVLIFGTLLGLRLAILLYFLIGFWGMYKLLRRFNAENIIAILLSYIWVFSSFPVWHIAGGHLTFAAYFLAPWFFLFILNIRSRIGWLWVGLFGAYLLNQSTHYITLHIFILSSVVALYQLIRYRNRNSKISLWILLKPYILSGGLVLVLAAHKLYFVFQYIHDYTRIPGTEAQTPLNLIIAALTFRGTNVLNPITFYKGGFGWAEYASYFGLLTLGLFAYFVIHKSQRRIQLKDLVLLGGIGIFFLLALGNFSPLSPYGLMKQLPVFSQMQVASRWLGWLVFGIIVYLAAPPRKKIFIALLFISVIDVFISSYSVINYNYGKHIAPKTGEFRQYAFYEESRVYSNSLRFFEATKANIGDIYGYEPILGFGGDINEAYGGLTKRCAINRNAACDLILSNNAEILYWSPNKIVLRRTGAGNIQLNINPGSYWRINGSDAFNHMRVTELTGDFTITDNTEEIVLSINP